MGCLSAIWGFLAIIGMFVGFIPLLGSLNWLLIPFAIGGILFSGIALALSGEKPRGSALTGIICCAVAALFGVARLILGGGVL